MNLRAALALRRRLNFDADPPGAYAVRRSARRSLLVSPFYVARVRGRPPCPLCGGGHWRERCLDELPPHRGTWVDESADAPRALWYVAGAGPTSSVAHRLSTRYRETRCR